MNFQGTQLLVHEVVYPAKVEIFNAVCEWLGRNSAHHLRKP